MASANAPVAAVTESELCGKRKERFCQVMKMLDTFEDQPEVTSNLQEMIDAKKDIWKVFKITQKHLNLMTMRIHEVSVRQERAKHQKNKVFIMAKTLELEPLEKQRELYQKEADKLFTNIKDLELMMKRIWDHESDVSELVGLMQPGDLDVYREYLIRHIRQVDLEIEATNNRQEQLRQRVQNLRNFQQDLRNLQQADQRRLEELDRGMEGLRNILRNRQN